MKITDVRLTAFSRPSPPDAKSVMVKGFSVQSLLSESVAVQVFTDEGFVGESISLGGGLGMAHYLAKNLKPMLIGRDPEYMESLWQDMWELQRLWFAPQFAIGTIDVALWDLFGKILNRPIATILGRYRDKLPVYASAFAKPTPEEYAEDAVRYKERKFHGYKLFSKGDPKADIAACVAVRKAVGDDFTLMFDAVSAYDLNQALTVGRALQELGFRWFEEPVREYLLENYRTLSAKLDIPICGLENNEGGLYSSVEFIRSGAVQVVRADVSLKYGVMQTRKIATLAEAFGLNCEVHTNPNPMLDAANLQVALSLKNTEYWEQFVPEENVRYATTDWLHIDSEGYVHAPQGPGHGLAIDWDFVNANKLAVL
jgi:L-alanine-DL-glutamate epimerase-like enolase superfamily enzyme